MDVKSGKPKKHILNRRYGIDRSDYQKDLKIIVSSFRPNSAIYGQMLLLETYDEVYGVHAHTDVDRPLSLVAHHDTEDYQKSSLEYQTLHRFAVNRVGKYFNISLLEYLQLPVATQHLMIDISMELSKEPIDSIEELNEEKN